MATRIWVARLDVSPATSEKLSSIHGLDADEIRQQVVCVAGLPFKWHDHPERGPRAILFVQIRGMKVLVVLYPAHDAIGDAWNLGSAYEVQG